MKLSLQFNPETPDRSLIFLLSGTLMRWLPKPLIGALICRLMPFWM
jgi:hypothetical protein